MLGNSKASMKQKQIALMYLYALISHEVGGHEIGGYTGVDARGKDIKVSEAIKNNTNETGYNDAGYYVEKFGIGVPNGLNDEQKKIPNIKEFDKVDTGNTKFKPGVMEGVYNKAMSTDEGRKKIPTVP
jgi:hypothetical protein